MLAAFLISACSLVNDHDELVLDLDTLQAEGPDGTFHAEPVPDAYVGAVDDDLFVALTVSEPEVDGEPAEVLVYFCDGDEIALWLSGDLVEGAASIAFDDGVVDVETGNGEWAGSLTLGDEEPQSFAVLEADGDAGLYVAAEIFDDMEYQAAWIVLPDGEQRGSSIPGSGWGLH